jgi:hypothetical protein
MPVLAFSSRWLLLVFAGLAKVVLVYACEQGPEHYARGVSFQLSVIMMSPPAYYRTVMLEISVIFGLSGSKCLLFFYLIPTSFLAF